MIGGIRNLVSTHLGRSSDYTVIDDMASGGNPGVVIGAGIGAAVGAVAGTAAGLHSLATDQVTIVTDRTEFTHPQLLGAKFIPEDCTTHFTYDDKGNLSGSYQTCDDPYFRPIIRENPTGLIQERQRFAHSNWLGPVSGALIGIGIGTVAGAIVGGIVGHLKEDSFASEPQRGVGNKTPLLGLAAGALVGAAGGAYAGSVAQSRAQDLVQTVRTPVTVNQRIGWVPFAREWSGLRNQADSSRQLFYETRLGSDEPYSGQREVVRAVPTGAFSEQVETSKSLTLTPLKGALIGAGLGAVVGGMSGVAVGVLQKHLASHA